MKQHEVERSLALELARLLKISPDSIDARRSFSELGLDSLGYAKMAGFIQSQLGVALGAEELFELPSLSATASRIVESSAPPAQPPTAGLSEVEELPEAGSRERSE